ncbi:hypothetical protein ANN_09871 [Periplaneta americana]|uniref:DUF4817 domain-containing protein n=1 Tax=Periplaneta americana TaxID=6978 RepID=A0ABQ8TP98_PERAM|nr:hypothetical protein ANN_09871 [Periplaneta americana]
MPKHPGSSDKEEEDEKWGKGGSLPSKETLRGHSDSSFRGEGYIQCCVGVRLYDTYSNQELAEIHFMYGKADGNAALARRLYQERYPQRQCPDRKTFVRLHYRLCEYGKFNSPGLGRGRPRSTTQEVQEEILEAVNMTPSISTRRVALQVNVRHTTVWRLLKEYQLYPYHLQHVQALSPADYPARVRFCQWFLQQCGVNPNIPALVLFTDEAQFTRDGITNFHNQHVWRMKTNVQLFHLITSRTARRYLDRRFPDRWIGRGGPIAFPPRSPDLNPLDFYLWGHLKSLVYSSPVRDLESLRNRIVACSEDIRNTPGVWDRVRKSMKHRCEVSFGHAPMLQAAAELEPSWMCGHSLLMAVLCTVGQDLRDRGEAYSGSIKPKSSQKRSFNLAAEEIYNRGKEFCLDIEHEVCPFQSRLGAATELGLLICVISSGDSVVCRVLSPGPMVLYLVGPGLRDRGDVYVEKVKGILQAVGEFSGCPWGNL